MERLSREQWERAQAAFHPAAPQDAPERTSNPDADRGHTWVVWRQDDHGNRAEVSRHPDRAAAEARAAELDGRGHKQTYWVAQTEG